MTNYQPLQYSSGYSLHLYCDHAAHPRYEYGPAEYTGETFADCARQAKAAGWRIFRATRTARCPRCVAAHAHPRPTKDSDHVRRTLGKPANHEEGDDH